MVVPDSEFPQRNVSGFSTIVGMIGHTKACLIIDKQWNGWMKVYTTFILSASITRGVTYAKLTHTVAEGRYKTSNTTWMG